jgi:hypothetical protein
VEKHVGSLEELPADHRREFLSGRGRACIALHIDKLITE